MYLLLQASIYDEWVSGLDYALVELTDGLLDFMKSATAAFEAAKAICPAITNIDLDDWSVDFLSDWEVEPDKFFSEVDEDDIDGGGWKLLTELPPHIQDGITDFNEEYRVEAVHMSVGASISWLGWLKNTTVEAGTDSFRLSTLLAEIEEMKKNEPETTL